MLFAILSLIVASAAAPLLIKRGGSRAAWLIAALPAALAIVLATGGLGGGDAPVRYAWVPALGVELGFMLDGLSLTFAVLITGIGSLIVIYAAGYLAQDPRLGGFLARLLLFMAAMLGLVLSDNLIGLFVFWELTSVSSYLLIGYHNDRPGARDAARRALLITGAGGLVLLAGFVLIAIAASQLGLSHADASAISALTAVDLRAHPLYEAIVVLVLIGAFTKSAQVPFHFWLPGAMVAPTPVSAYLHSATMVKAGVFLLARLNPTLGGTPLWQISLIAVGAVTLAFGAWLAIRQRDLKRILAYSTVSVLGALTLLVGVGTHASITAFVALVIAHALYKAALFMLAGNVDHATGTRDIGQLGGLRAALPVTAVVAALASVSMLGAPPLFGFIAKESLYTAMLTADVAPLLLLAVAIGASVLLVIVALRVGVSPFFGPPRGAALAPHAVPRGMSIGPCVLALLGLLFGLAPGALSDLVGLDAAAAIAGEPVAIRLAMWHGLSGDALVVVIASALTVLAGCYGYRVLRVDDRMAATDKPSLAQRGFDASLAAVMSLARAVTHAVHNGNTRRYVVVIMLCALALASAPLVHALTPVLSPDDILIHWHEAALVLVAIAGAIMTVLHRGRLTAVAALGVSGLAIALVFAMFSAPDLAITQLMVETLTVILFVLIFRHLPPVVDRSSVRRKLRDAAIAVAVGAMMTGLVLASSAIHLPPDVANFFAESSAPVAYGRNVVNVVLVDFRALDTLGEITVVAVAGLGVYALVRLRSRVRVSEHTGKVS